MKKIVISAGIVLLSIAGIGQTTNLAKVESLNGLNLFIKSEPVAKFTSLGMVSMPALVLNGKPREMIRIASKRARAQYPDADGIIFRSDQFGEVEAIKTIAE